MRSRQEVSKERITSVADQYFTNLWCVGASQGRGAPSIEYMHMGHMMQDEEVEDREEVEESVGEEEGRERGGVRGMRRK